MQTSEFEIAPKSEAKLINFIFLSKKSPETGAPIEVKTKKETS
jgi:hypothetical protein